MRDSTPDVDAASMSGLHYLHYLPPSSCILQRTRPNVHCHFRRLPRLSFVATAMAISQSSQIWSAIINRNFAGGKREKGWWGWSQFRSSCRCLPLELKKKKDYFFLKKIIFQVMWFTKVTALSHHQSLFSSIWQCLRSEKAYIMNHI